MAQLYFIRHGMAGKSWGEDRDPPLAADGKQQAAARARTLAESMQPMEIISSPLRRCQETAEPLCSTWGVRPTIVAAVSEIPTPARLQLKDKTLADRAAWLRALRDKEWKMLANEASLLLWKKHLLDWAFHRTEDSVVFSHFIAINVLLGAARADDRFIAAQPNYCSLWVFDNSEGFVLKKAGEEMATRVL